MMGLEKIGIHWSYTARPISYSDANSLARTVPKVRAASPAWDSTQK
jgi:hypothetical protein